MTTALPIVESCQGCERVASLDDAVYCKSYPNPAAKWRLGVCNFATHVKSQTKAAVKVNPLKASKRANKKK
jgi:hypothetical protein